MSWTLLFASTLASSITLVLPRIEVRVKSRTFKGKAADAYDPNSNSSAAVSFLGVASGVPSPGCFAAINASRQCWWPASIIGIEYKSLP